jgi:thiosulfate reductase cytochrome b subunit
VVASTLTEPRPAQSRLVTQWMLESMALNFAWLNSCNGRDIKENTYMPTLMSQVPFCYCAKSLNIWCFPFTFCVALWRLLNAAKITHAACGWALWINLTFLHYLSTVQTCSLCVERMRCNFKITRSTKNGRYFAFLPPHSWIRHASRDKPSWDIYDTCCWLSRIAQGVRFSSRLSRE